MKLAEPELAGCLTFLPKYEIVEAWNHRPILIIEIRPPEDLK